LSRDPDKVSESFIDVEISKAHRDAIHPSLSELWEETDSLGGVVAVALPDGRRQANL
jgi:hypothetical protein